MNGGRLEMGVDSPGLELNRKLINRTGTDIYKAKLKHFIDEI